LQHTTNYNLKKPESTDNYNVENDNENMDIIDTELQLHANTIGNMTTVPTTSKIVAGAITELHADIANIDVVPPDGSITPAKLSFDPATQGELDAVAGVANAAKSTADAALPKAGGTISGDLQVLGVHASQTTNVPVEIKDSTNSKTVVNSAGTGVGAGAAFQTFHRPDVFAANIGIDTDNKWKVGGYSMGKVAYELWHDGRLRIAAGGGLEYFDGTTWRVVSNDMSQYKDVNTTYGETSIPKSTDLVLLNVTAKKGFLQRVGIFPRDSYAGDFYRIRITVDGVVKFYSLLGSQGSFNMLTSRSQADTGNVGESQYVMLPYPLNDPTTTRGLFTVAPLLANHIYFENSLKVEYMNADPNNYKVIRHIISYALV